MYVCMHVCYFFENVCMYMLIGKDFTGEFRDQIFFLRIIHSRSAESLRLGEMNDVGHRPVDQAFLKSEKAGVGFSPAQNGPQCAGQTWATSIGHHQCCFMGCHG